MTKKGQHKAKIGKKEIVEQDNKNVTTTPQQDEEEEVNSGFSNYLRSSTGLCCCHPFTLQRLFNKILYFRSGDAKNVCSCQFNCCISYNRMATNENFV